MNVLVVGATGYMGRETVRLAIEAGMKVRAMTRVLQRGADLAAMGAEVIQGDLIDPTSLARACQGMDAVVSAAHSLMGTAPYTSAAVDDVGQRNLVSTARSAGVKHFVFTSMLGVSPTNPIDFNRYKYAIEQDVQNSEMHYTILRPPAFMEWHAHNLLGKDMLEKGKTTIFGKGDNPINFMSANDVAVYAILGLTNPRACDRILEIGGLENVTKNQVAEMYMRISGKPADVSHMPRMMLQIMGGLMSLFKPEIARVIKLAYLADTTDQTFNPAKILAEFPMQLTRLEDFIKLRVEEARKA